MVDENSGERDKPKIFNRLRTNTWVIITPIILITIIVIAGAIAGSMIKYDIPGEYDCYVYGEKMGAFNIYEDGTFSFSTKMLGGVYQNGNWEKTDENTIILQYSDGTTETIDLNLNEGSFEIGSTTYQRK